MLNLLKKPLSLYLMMIALGISCGISNVDLLHSIGSLISEVFIRLFKALSVPIIALSLIVTISGQASNGMGQLWRKTITYTISTTIIAALVAMGLYLIIQPTNISQHVTATNNPLQQNGYLHYLVNLVPSNFFSPFVESQVMSVLVIGLVIGFAIRQIPDKQAQQAVIQLFKGLHSLLFVITKWVVAILPIGIFGFVSVSVT